MRAAVETISDRLKWIRGELRLSQRAMAEAVHCSVRAWQSWEYGRTSPSAEILGHLVELGFNGNWILTGDGPTRRLAQGVAGDDPQLMEEIRQLRSTGLDDLFLLARRGTQDSLWRLLQVLNSSPGDSMSPREIRDYLLKAGEEIEIADVVADCRLLDMYDLVTEVKVGRELRYKVNSGSALRPTQAVDVLQAVRETVRTLGIRVLPAIRRLNRSGYLANMEIRAPKGRGQEVIIKMREAAVSFVESNEWDGPERVYIALGMAVDGEAEDPA